MADGAITENKDAEDERTKYYDLGYHDGYDDGWEDANSRDSYEPTESEAEFYCRIFELIQSGNVKKLHLELTEKIQDVTGKTITNWKIIGE